MNVDIKTELVKKRKLAYLIQCRRLESVSEKTSGLLNIIKSIMCVKCVKHIASRQ